MEVKITEFSDLGEVFLNFGLNLYCFFISVYTVS